MVNHPNRGRGPFTLTAVPLSVLNRALEIFGQGHEATAEHAWAALREATAAHAWAALRSADGRISVDGPYTPLAQAVAEYMSLSGPWAEDGGEHAGESGYAVEER